MKTKVVLIILIISSSSFAQLPSECLATEEKLYVQALITENESDLDMEGLDLESCNDDEVMSGLRKARLFRDNGSRNEAEELLMTLLKRENLKKEQSAEINYKLGELCYLDGRYKVAIDYMHAAEKFGKSTWYTQNAIARSYMLMAEVEKATSVLESYIINHPKNHSAHNSLGLCYEYFGMVDKALDSFKTAFHLSEGKEPYYANDVISLLAATNREKEGIDFGLEAIDKGPQLEELWYEVAYFYDKIGDHENARGISERMVELFPESSNALFRLAYAHDKLGHANEALKYYFMNLELKPEEHGALGNISKLYRELGLFELSHEYLDMAITLRPRSKLYHGYKADNYLWEHRFKEYKSQCIWIYNEFDRDKSSNSDMAYALLVNGEFKEAIPWYEDAVTNYPGSSRNHNNLARAYHKTEQYELAEQHYKKALSFDKENSYAYHNMASMYADRGKSDLACEYLGIAMEKHYNWIIDEKLVAIHDEHCPEISIDREILLFGYSGNLEEYEGQPFIEIREMDEALKIRIIQGPDDVEKLEPKVNITKDSQFQLYRVYPNPSQDRFFIEPNTDSEFTSSTTVKVFDMNSKLVLQQALVNGTKEMIDFSSQPSGTYILLISDEEKVLFNQRLVVSR